MCSMCLCGKIEFCDLNFWFFSSVFCVVKKDNTEARSSQSCTEIFIKDT